MSATTPTVQGGLGSRQLGAALAAIVLAIVLIAVLAVGLQAASRSQVTSHSDNALPARPVFDHGSATLGSDTTVAAPVFDHGTASLSYGRIIPAGPIFPNNSDTAGKASGYSGGLMNPGEIVQNTSGRSPQRMTR